MPDIEKDQTPRDDYMEMKDGALKAMGRILQIEDNIQHLQDAMLAIRAKLQTEKQANLKMQLERNAMRVHQEYEHNLEKHGFEEGVRVVCTECAKSFARHLNVM